MGTATATNPVVEAEIDRLASSYEAWAEECYTIRDKHRDLRPLSLNPLQRAIGEAEESELAARGRARLFVLKGRQGGVSTDQQARNLHAIWATPGANVITLAHKREATDKIFEITRRAVELFPTPLLPTLGQKGAREISFPGLDSHFWTETAGGGDAARGLTLLRAHLSEAAFYDSLRAVLKSLEGLVPLGSVCTLETTASAYGSEAHEFWMAARDGANSYRALFFPWWLCDPTLYRLPLFESDELGALDEEEQRLVATQGLTLEQLKWRREKIGDLGGRDDFLQEYPEDDESCWLSAGGMFFDANLLRSLMLVAPEPIESEHPSEGGELRIYARPEGERVIIGSDTAEGGSGSGDRSTWTARAFPSWRLLEEYESRTIEPKAFARLLAQRGRHYQYALLVVEKNMHGITVLRELRDEHHYPTSAIYHRPSSHDRAEREDERSDRIGWATTAESQPLMLDAGRELLNAVRNGYAGNPSTAMLRDAFRVRRNDKGKIEFTGLDVLTSEMLCWLGRQAKPSRVLVA